MTDNNLAVGPADGLQILTSSWDYTLPLGGPTQRAEMAVLRTTDEDIEILEYEQDIHPEGDPHCKCSCSDYKRYRITVGQSILIGAWSWCAGQHALCGQRVMH